MTKVVVRNFSISLDGYAAGPGQDLDHPLGVGGRRLHEWIFATRHGQAMIGRDGGEGGVDDDAFAGREDDIGATIIGRNMFGPLRGPWGDHSWSGWWGEEPPFHHDVFVLTHYPRPPIEMEGGTTFRFVETGIESALEQAAEAAAGGDVLVGGGACTIRQYLRAGLIDEVHLVLVPVILGDGERLFEAPGDAEGYECVEHTASAAVVHLRLVRAEQPALLDADSL